MEQLYNSVKRTYSKIEEPTITYTELSTNEIELIDNEIDDSKFTFNKIEITKNILILTYRLVTITVCNYSRIPLQKLINVGKRVQTLLTLYKYDKIIKITFLPTVYDRELPLPNKPIDPKHINGGFTYFKNGIIYVYRVQEFPKVMLHETLHNLKFNTELPIVLNLFPDKLPNEAVIEFWAELFQAMFVTIDYQQFLKAVELEKSWAYKQTYRLQRHFKSLDKLKESTNAFAYIVLRYILFESMDEFLKLKIPYSPLEIKRFFDNRLPLKPLKPVSLKGNGLAMSWFGDL